MSIRRIIFISKSAPETHYGTLLDLLSQTKVNNPQRGITSVLIWDGTFFLQVLEGTDDVLESLIEKIRKDIRHFDVKIISDETISERAIDSWYMSYINSSKIARNMLTTIIGADELSYESLNKENALVLAKEAIQYL